MYIDGYISLDEKNQALKEKVKLNYQKKKIEIQIHQTLTFTKVLSDQENTLKAQVIYWFLVMLIQELSLAQKEM